MNRPVFDAERSVAVRDLGDLPEWDLTDLYATENAPELSRDLAWLATAGSDFAGKYEGRLADLDADGMLACVKDYEEIDRVAGRVMSFAGLRHYQNTTDSDRAKFLTDCHDKITTATTPLVFFSLEVNRIDDDRLDRWFAESEGLARYRPVFDRLRALKPYQLSDELERFLHDQSVVGAAAWNSLFDETLAALEFEVDGEVMGLEFHPQPADRAGPRQTRGRRPLRRRRPVEPDQDLLARPQHADQGQGDLRPLAQAADPADVAPPRQPRRAGGGGGAAQRRRRRLPQALAPLLRAQAALARPGPDAGLGPQRPPADGGDADHRLG